MYMQDCISCATLTGANPPLGGIIYENNFWMVVMRAKPVLIAGSAFIILKRHCEDFNDLTSAELHTMSETMQLLSRAYEDVLQPEKVHFGLYGEGVKHIHIHVLPRTSNLPAGNIPLMHLRQWYQILQFLRLKRSISDEHVTQIASQMRENMYKLVAKSRE